MTNKDVIITNIMISHSALNGITFKESIDLALVGAAFDQQVNLIFVDHGIAALLTGQNNQSLLDKNHADILKGLEFYDIENIYLEKETLDRSQISVEHLQSMVQLKTAEEIKHLNTLAHHLVVF